MRIEWSASLVRMASLLLLCAVQAQAEGRRGWTQSYAAGYTDGNGKYCGGSEIMHLVAHKGRLFAFNGFWKDSHFGKHSAQVLRLDAPDATWQVDLETTKEALRYAYGDILHMKGNILKSVRFGTDRAGRKIDVNLLIAASWAFNSNEKGHQATSVFVRNDETGTWTHAILQQGPRDLRLPDGRTAKVRRVPRDLEIYRDRVTGVDRIFLLGGDTGIFSGVYDASLKRIVWDTRPEHPKGGAVFPARPLGIAEANGCLFISTGGKLFRRKDGPGPTWILAYEMSGRINTEMGGIRGLTTIRNPKGPGDSLLFVWTPVGRCPGEIKRLDGPELRESTETSLRALFDEEFKKDGITSRGSLGGYNRFLPLKDPRTGRTVHLVGYQQTINTPDESLKWNGYYKGALYSIRSEAGTYTTRLVNGRWDKTKPVLVAPRTFEQSPFPGDRGAVYFGGHDANFAPSTDMAWIFKADLETVLYGAGP